MAILGNALMLIGSGFLVIAALGVLRMPDFYMRMSSASKGVTLGVGCLAVGLAFHMEDAGVTTRVLLILLLFFLKAPVAAHMLARAAYMNGIPLWEGTLADELSERGDPLATGGRTPEAEEAVAGAPNEEHLT